MGFNTKYIFTTAQKNTPKVQIEGKEGWLRHNVVDLLEGEENVGIELGVAQGIFSKRMLESLKFKRFYGVDVYGDIHDTAEYLSTLKYIGYENPKYCLLRMDFESAVDLFEDEFFDFVYVDGYAHTGEEGGKTLIDWWGKMKVGGILAGDDYHNDWPLVVWAVNHLANQLGVRVNVTLGEEEDETGYCKYPTWWIEKTELSKKPSLDPLLFDLSMKEKRRVHRNRTGIKRKFIKAVGSVLNIIGLKDAVRSILNLIRSQ